MAPQHEASPLITGYRTGQTTSASFSSKKAIRRVSSIQDELGKKETGTASTFDVGINLAKTAGMNMKE